MTPEPPELPLLRTADGSLSAHSKRYGQAYASRHGARAQALAVFVRGTGVAHKAAPRVLEVGFGLGNNLRATLEHAGAPDCLAFEHDPVPAALLARVSRGDPAAGHPLWQALLDGWDAGMAGGGLDLERAGARLRVRRADMSRAALPQAWADAVYLDAFSPDRNPELWTPAFLAALAGALAPGGCLATYSAAGAVRRGLAAAGLSVRRVPGASVGLPGKREFLVAVRPG